MSSSGLLPRGQCAAARLDSQTMPRPQNPQYAGPRGSKSRRFAMYFLGVAIGLMLVGLLKQMRQIMVPKPLTPADNATVDGPAAEPGP